MTSCARSLAVVAVLALGACPPPQTGTFVGALPPGVSVELTGTFAFSDEELVLQLEQPCFSERPASAEAPAGSTYKMRCSREQLDAIEVTAETPWHEKVRGVWKTPREVAFHADWSHGGYDLLGKDPDPIAARPWLIAGQRWAPSEAQAKRMIELSTRASDTDLALAHGGPAPALAVRTIEVEGGALHPGKQGTLRVAIANLGQGTAYRVVAATRSSVESLHDRHLLFGAIKPGAEVVRQLAVEVPSGETSPDTMLVLEVAEGNGASPPNANRRIPILATPTVPQASLKCAILGDDAPRPTVEAGASVTVRCVVSNTSDATDNVALEASAAGGPLARGASQSVAPAAQATVELPVMIPRGVIVGSPVEIAVTVRDTQAGPLATTKLVAVAAKARLCKPGQLTRAQYKTKLTELRAAVTAGDMTQGQLDRYDAELLTCLK